MTYMKQMISWASGMVEFIGAEPAPEGAIVCCTVHHPHAFEELLHAVEKQLILHDFGDVGGLRVPGIDPARTEVESGVDFAVDILIRWEEGVRESLGFFNDIEWTRS